MLQHYEALSGPCVLSLAAGVAQQMYAQLCPLAIGHHFGNNGAGRTLLPHNVAETYATALALFTSRLSAARAGIFSL